MSNDGVGYHRRYDKKACCIKFKLKGKWYLVAKVDGFENEPSVHCDIVDIDAYSSNEQEAIIALEYLRCHVPLSVRNDAEFIENYDDVLKLFV